MTFEKLVRFEDSEGIHYGELVDSNHHGYKVIRLEGSPFEGFERVEGEAINVVNLLCPLESTPIIQCIGVNYRQHATESKLDIPKFPVVFSKPADALAGPLQDIDIHPDCQSMMDYEGELTVIIGKDAKNVTAADALDYVLGYTNGNDVSARNYQLKDASGGQYGYAKSFDGFAPIGPAIHSTKLVPDPQTLHYVTRVNGAVVQETGTDDMIWSVRQIIEHLSRGTTLRRGTVIMTGTPAGVGFFQKRFLKDGDIVEVELEGFDKIANKLVFVQ